MNLKTQPLHPKTRQMNTQDKQNLYIYKSRSLNQVLPRQVKSLSKKLTRIKFKFLKPHGAFRDMPLQSSDNTRLSIKKKKNNRNKRSTILKKSALYSRSKRNPQKKKKKKKKEAKTLKPKTSSPIKIHTRSAYRLFSVPSNTQIGLEL